MKIVIEEEELKDIIANYLREQMPDRANENFDVKFTAGRGPQGHYAEIEVSKRDAPATPTGDSDDAKETEDDGSEAAINPFASLGEDDD